MAAQCSPVFHGLMYGSMLVVNEEIAALADRVALKLPRIVERARLIDHQACRDCGHPFPLDPDADRCVSCVTAMLGERFAA